MIIVRAVVFRTSAALYSTHEPTTTTDNYFLYVAVTSLFPIKGRKDNFQEMTDLECFNKYLDYLFSFIFRQRRHLSQCIRGQTKMCEEKVKAIVGCE